MCRRRCVSCPAVPVPIADTYSLPTRPSSQSSHTCPFPPLPSASASCTRPCIAGYHHQCRPPRIETTRTNVAESFSAISPLESQSQWVPEVRHFCPNVPFVLVGCKSDLRNDPSTIAELQKNKQHPVCAAAPVPTSLLFCLIQMSPLCLIQMYSQM
jgi:hypothetical protein